MILSWGLSRPVYTWKLAGEPRGPALTPHFSGRGRMVERVAHSVSAWSMNSLPPWRAPGSLGYLLVMTEPIAHDGAG